MFRVIYCIKDHHDLRLVFLAAVICLMSSFAAMHLTQRARATTGLSQFKWIAVAGLATGCGIWATHFIAMMAYDPGVALRYDILMTVFSLVAAVVVTAIGIGLAVRHPGTPGALAGGAIVGIGIGVMHFMGMAALRFPGYIAWAPDLVGSSIVLSMLLCAVSLLAAVRARDGYRTAMGALLLVLAIVAMHFTAMGAATIIPEPMRLAEGVALSASTMSIAIASVVTCVLFVCSAAALQGRKLDAAERNFRLMVEGVKDYAICMLDTQGHVTNWNSGAEAIKGYTAEEILGKHFEIFYPEEARAAGEPARLLALALENGSHEIEEGLRLRKDGTEFWANVIMTAIYNDRNEHVGFAKVTRDISRRKAYEARINHLARYDSLTGLPNRDNFVQWLEQELARADARHEQVAVIAIDLDRFKEINDLRGHAAGDVVLRTVAERMNADRSAMEFVARLGGDEFVAVKRLQNDHELNGFIEHLTRSLTDAIDLDGFEIKPGGSLGIALYPEDGSTRDVLLSNADLALYRAKSSLGEKVCFYEARMDETARAQRALAKDLWQAVDNGELHLHYQVQKAIESGEITGYEALLRWNHPTRGSVSPGEFIPIAEECGAIIDIGKWVLKQACLQAARWPDHIKIAVNLSPVQLSSVDIIDAVREILIETGISPHRLELEITESAIIGDTARALHILRQIKALGVTFAIDDFGTGYSSLATLNAFPFDKIKIDQSFLRDLDTNPQSRAIVRAVIALGNSLNMPVLAEGVETRDQLDLLQSEGCAEAQGYLLGRPQPADGALESQIKAAVR
jgi:diguanylate cyclase (GGDEF)-like protein/PAS domain S-box-containing protein